MIKKITLPEPEVSMLKILPRWALPIHVLYYDEKVPYWCQLKYPGHPKGCPNFGKRQNCSPRAPIVTDLFDFNSPMFMVWSEFDLASFAAHMKEKHPNWSDRQCRCALYWQETSKKQARNRTEILISRLKDNRYKAHHMAHAAGVQFYKTAAANGLVLERIKDLKINRHVSLVGVWKAEDSLLKVCKH